MNSPTDPYEKQSTCRLGSTGGRCELDANLEILRNVHAFSGIPLPRLKLYAYLSRRMCYKAGEFVFRQHDSANRGYIIVSGKAQVIREYKDHSLFLNELQEGDFFGGLALLSEVKRLFTVKAVTNLECLTLDRESYRRLLAQFPEVAVKILDTMIKRIVQMEEKLFEEKLHECVYG